MQNFDKGGSKTLTLARRLFLRIITLSPHGNYTRVALTIATLLPISVSKILWLAFGSSIEPIGLLITCSDNFLFEA